MQTSTSRLSALLLSFCGEILSFAEVAHTPSYELCLEHTNSIIPATRSFRRAHIVLNCLGIPRHDPRHQHHQSSLFLLQASPSDYLSAGSEWEWVILRQSVRLAQHTEKECNQKPDDENKNTCRGSHPVEYSFFPSCNVGYNSADCACQPATA